MNGIRFCSDCKFDMDAESAVPCETHTWHEETWSDAPDMCCNCGLDWEMMFK